MSSLDVARRRLNNSGLVGGRFETPEEVVRWHGAMQAQDYGPAKWSIGRRARALKDSDVDDALEQGRIVRTHVLRETWHFVVAKDIRWMLALTGPRIARQSAGRHRELGLDARTLSRSASAIAKALEGDRRLTRRDLAEVLTVAGIDPGGQRMSHILIHCELEAIICSGGLEGKQHTYALFDERVKPSRPLERDEAVLELTRRYLSSHGPATMKDLSWWATLTAADIRNALDALDGQVASEQVHGVTLWSIADRPRASAVRGARLLQTYDEFLVGYTESRFLGDARADMARAAWKDRGTPTGLVLVDGAIAGHWKRSKAKDSMTAGILLYEEPTESVWKALRAEAKALSRFHGLEVTVEIGRMPRRRPFSSR